MWWFGGVVVTSVKWWVSASGALAWTTSRATLTGEMGAVEFLMKRQFGNFPIAFVTWYIWLYATSHNMSHCFAGMECLLIRENVNPSGGRSNWSCSSMWSRLSSSMWSRLRPRCFNHSLDLSPIPVLNLDFHRTDVENSTQSLSFSKQCHKIYLRHKLTEASPCWWAFPRLDFGLISWTNLRIHGVAAPTNMEAADHSLPSVPQFNDHHHHAWITLEKSQQMQPMRIYLFLGSLFEDTF